MLQVFVFLICEPRPVLASWRCLAGLEGPLGLQDACRCLFEACIYVKTQFADRLKILRESWIKAWLWSPRSPLVCR